VTGAREPTETEPESLEVNAKTNKNGMLPESHLTGKPPNKKGPHQRPFLANPPGAMAFEPTPHPLRVTASCA
jgi:hypothetical protein